MSTINVGINGFGRIGKCCFMQLFEDDNVGIAYGNFVGFILDVIIFFGLPLTTIILFFSFPVKIAKELLNFKKI